jgi:hypothetical protein
MIINPNGGRILPGHRFMSRGVHNNRKKTKGRNYKFVPNKTKVKTALGDVNLYDGTFRKVFAPIGG